MSKSKKVLTRMMIENEQCFIDALKSDLNKPVQVGYYSEFGQILPSMVTGQHSYFRHETCDGRLLRNLLFSLYSDIFQFKR